MDTQRRKITVDGNEAAASVAYRLSEVIAIYPITPSSPMGELSDEWAADHRHNVWGNLPQVTEMQSEAGAAGALHGAMQAGSLTTSFTASQGLLLMIPNMYKWAGELNACVLHVTARTVATHALSIFGDHSDVMACRQTGFALLASGSVQEAHDLACVAHAATLQSRLPFLHFFDGFRTSHEVAKMEELTDADLRAMVDEAWVLAHRQRALTPDHPVIRGTSQNPDVFFQNREAGNRFTDACPGLVQQAMDRFAGLTGRSYHLFDYVGHPQPERVLVLMGSGAEVAHETVEWLAAHDERVGLIKVRLYRPFDVAAFAAALPSSTQAIAVLDRTKEPGAPAEPLHLDVVAALQQAARDGHWQSTAPDGALPKVIGGRYGLGSKEFDPSMVKAVLDELKRDTPKDHFTVGIDDDVTHTSLTLDRSFDIEPDSVVRAVFYGLGADGTVSANKNSIKIIGEQTPNYAQGYFIYDSKKSGGTTISHLRFGPAPIRSSYLIRRASFVGCHQTGLLDQFDVVGVAAPGAVFLLNTPYPPDQAWDQLPREVQDAILAKDLRCYVIDAYEVAKRSELGVRINTIMQTCFFAISGVLPRDEAISRIKRAITKTYGKKGEEVVQRNHAAVDETLANLHPLTIPATATATHHRRPAVPDAAPEFVRQVEAAMMIGQGDTLPVSVFPVDGTWPLGTSRWEKRNLAREIPIWAPEICIQCGKCAFVCPHSTIRTKLYEAEALQEAGGPPPGFRMAPARGRGNEGRMYTVQVAPEDCTGCRLCVTVCPAKDRKLPRRRAINMAPQHEHRTEEAAFWDFFLALPAPRPSAPEGPESEGTELALEVAGQGAGAPGQGSDSAGQGSDSAGQGSDSAGQGSDSAGQGARAPGQQPRLGATAITSDVKGSQLLQPLFEYAGACAGCGETQYIKLLTQLFGDRTLIANATGCTSIYGGNLPTTPYTTDDAGRGPAWSNSLFEDNAEFGLGMRLAVDQQRAWAATLLGELAATPAGAAIVGELAGSLLATRISPTDLAGVTAQRERVAELRRRLPLLDLPAARRLEPLVDSLVPKTVWAIGGDGWAYDIGYGGLDHVLSMDRDLNLLVLDTEVYSNTGGQQSKATSIGATAKFASAGKAAAKKDLGWMAMAYGTAYVAQVSWGARDQHTVRVLQEAASYPGPSLVIAYAHCIAHGYDLAFGAQQQKLAVDSGHWLLYRYDPRRRAEGLPPLQLDSAPPKVPLEEYLYNETRYRMLQTLDPARSQALLAQAKDHVRRRYARYEHLSRLVEG